MFTNIFAQPLKLNRRKLTPAMTGQLRTTDHFLSGLIIDMQYIIFTYHISCNPEILFFKNNGK